MLFCVLFFKLTVLLSQKRDKTRLETPFVRAGHVILTSTNVACTGAACMQSMNSRPLLRQSVSTPCGEKKI